jgi:hypothetical protein
VLSARVRRSLEEELDWHLQYFRHSVQAARADPVRTLFIFLHLLERNAEHVAELCLGHAKHQPAHAHSASHVLVNRVSSVLWHRVSVLAHGAPRNLHYLSVWGKWSLWAARERSVPGTLAAVVVQLPPMAKEMTLESLAKLVTKGFASADKKFTALAEDNAAIEKRLDARLDKLDSGMSNLSGKIEHLGTKLTKFEESEIDKRKQLEVRVAAIEKHLGIDRKIAA